MSAVTDKFVSEAEENLAKVEAEINSKVEPLVNEQKELKAFIKKHTKGAAKVSPAISEEDLVAAVAEVAKKGPAKTKEIAEFLAVDSRNIARRLSALAQNSECAIVGNKDDGYTA